MRLRFCTSCVFLAGLMIGDVFAQVAPPKVSADVYGVRIRTESYSGMSSGDSYCASETVMEPGAIVRIVI